MSKKESILANRIKSIGYACKGALLLIKTEISIQVQFAMALFVTAAGFLFNISKFEWIAQLFAMGLVMSIEGLNTAIEEIANFIHPEHNKNIGRIKDIAAGAVFIAAIFATIIGCIIYIPKIF